MTSCVRESNIDSRFPMTKIQQRSRANTTPIASLTTPHLTYTQSSTVTSDLWIESPDLSVKAPLARQKASKALAVDDQLRCPGPPRTAAQFVPRFIICLPNSSTHTATPHSHNLRSPIHVWQLAVKLLQSSDPPPVVGDSKRSCASHGPCRRVAHPPHTHETVRYTGVTTAATVIGSLLELVRSVWTACRIGLSSRNNSHRVATGNLAVAQPYHAIHPASRPHPPAWTTSGLSPTWALPLA